jgi:hypothetical protein
MILDQELLAEARKFQTFQLACLREFYLHRSELLNFSTGNNDNGPNVLLIRCGPLTSRSKMVDLDAW